MIAEELVKGFHIVMNTICPVWGGGIQRWNGQDCSLAEALQKRHHRPIDNNNVALIHQNLSCATRSAQWLLQMAPKKTCNQSEIDSDQTVPICQEFST